jgi:hypothetical protein
MNEAENWAQGHVPMVLLLRKLRQEDHLNYKLETSSGNVVKPLSSQNKTKQSPVG